MLLIVEKYSMTREMKIKELNLALRPNSCV